MKKISLVLMSLIFITVFSCKPAISADSLTFNGIYEMELNFHSCLSSRLKEFSIPTKYIVVKVKKVGIDKYGAKIYIVKNCHDDYDCPKSDLIGKIYHLWNDKWVTTAADLKFTNLKNLNLEVPEYPIVIGEARGRFSIDIVYPYPFPYMVTYVGDGIGYIKWTSYKNKNIGIFNSCGKMEIRSRFIKEFEYD